MKKIYEAPEFKIDRYMLSHTVAAGGISDIWDGVLIGDDGYGDAF